ncbi:MAG: hypothetical protein WBG01_08260 [Bacteroidota bacterium]
MIRNTVFALVALFLSAPSLADVRVKEATYSNKVSWGSEGESKLLTSNTIWVGDNKIVFKETKRTLILDREKGVFVYVIPRTRTYVETPIPLDVSMIFPAEQIRKRKHQGSSGEVEPTGDSKKFLERESQEFEITSWYYDGDIRKGEREFRVWATTDVPFDVELYHDMLEILREIHNRDEAYRAELTKMKGLQMYLELSEGNWFSGQKVITEILEIKEMTPPEAIYEVPEGYTRKAELAEEDLQ